MLGNTDTSSIYFASFCQAGYYESHKGNCRLCPQGAECLVYANTSQLQLKQGFWRTSKSSDNVLACRYEELCEPNDGCLEGHRGPYCRLCIANYFKSVGEACVGCVAGATSWALVFVVVLVFTLVIFLGLKFYRKSSKRFRHRAKALGKIMYVFSLLTQTSIP